MKKKFVYAYLNKNLGDDLFLKILSDRYDEKFICFCNPKRKYIGEFDNIKFNKSKILFFVNRIIEKITTINICRTILLKLSPILIVIGGSMFIEKTDNIKQLKKKLKIYKGKKKRYILGVNFGPYKTKEYKEYVEREILNKSEDVCFRDKYSYNMFKQSKNIRYAPDIVFSLNTEKIKQTDEKRAIISVIDCSKRFENKTYLQYEEKIIELIRLLNSKNYKITLMSFCDEEGDLRAINSIKSKIQDDILKNSIDLYSYNGDIEEALNLIGQSKIVVASRFHAAIIGLVLNKTIIPIIYSNKTSNVLNDIDFKGKIFDIRSSKKFNINEITDDDLNYKLDVSKCKKESEKHFEKLDLILRRKEY